MKPCSDSELAISSFLLLLFFFCSSISADDIQDLCPTEPHINGFLCKNRSTVTASDFNSSRLNHASETNNFLRSSASVATVAEFPGFNTQGLALSRVDFAVDAVIPPHSHPRASEIMFLSSCTVVAGFQDTGGRLFSWTLRDDDVSVFPGGLLHFCANAGLASRRPSLRWRRVSVGFLRRPSRERQ